MMSDDVNVYYDTNRIKAAVQSGDYRDIVGGLWEEAGRLQFDFLVKQGLRPEHRFLDVGCGALRGGIHFVKYLNSGHYYGMDLSQDLLDAGYEKELGPLGLQKKLPRAQLLADSQFDFSRIGTKIDRALAFSVFTHLPLDRARVCLEKLAAVMRPGGKFYATFFEAPEGKPTHPDMHHEPGGIVTHAGIDPFHHRLSDYAHLIKGLPWDLEHIGEFGHPRDQRMLCFTRREDVVYPEGDTRSLTVAEAGKLPPGADHYRAYVGPPDRYDYIGASQFALLFQAGLRDRHKVLDFGCGSLRLGRLLIPFLRKGGYFGLDPNRWLIEEGLDRELGRDAQALKAPRFAYNEDFNCNVFGEKFDFIIAQSILTHTGPDLLKRFIETSAAALNPNGIILFSYIRDPAATKLPGPGWHYPACVGYTEPSLNSALAAGGLTGHAVPWFHPGATWHMAVHKANQSLAVGELAQLNGRAVKSGI